ncbi:MAG: hypothetical protein ACM3UX_00295 [Candidatus Woesearchaeota archaeon]
MRIRRRGTRTRAGGRRPVVPARPQAAAGHAEATQAATGHAEATQPAPVHAEATRHWDSSGTRHKNLVWRRHRLAAGSPRREATPELDHRIAVTYPGVKRPDDRTELGLGLQRRAARVHDSEPTVYPRPDGLEEQTFVHPLASCSLKRKSALEQVQAGSILQREAKRGT